MDIKELLREITRLMPPGEGQRHNITFNGQSLELTIMQGDKYIPVIIEQDDFNKDLNYLATEIITLVRGVE